MGALPPFFQRIEHPPTFGSVQGDCMLVGLHFPLRIAGFHFLRKIDLQFVELPVVKGNSQVRTGNPDMDLKYILISSFLPCLLLGVDLWVLPNGTYRVLMLNSLKKAISSTFKHGHSCTVMAPPGCDPFFSGSEANAAQGRPTTGPSHDANGCVRMFRHVFESVSNTCLRFVCAEGLAVGVGFGAIGKTPSATFESAR